jgi:hypothetical protein
VHVDFVLLQRLSLPITVGSVRYPGIKLHDPRVIRLLEVFLPTGTQVGGWNTKQIHQAFLFTFRISESKYGLNQLRYDLRKLKGHALLERDGSCYAYRLTPIGAQVALLFLFFHKRLCGRWPTAASTIAPQLIINRQANWKTPITVPMPRSSKSSICSLLPDSQHCLSSHNSRSPPSCHRLPVFLSARHEDSPT